VPTWLRTFAQVFRFLNSADCWRPVPGFASAANLNQAAVKYQRHNQTAEPDRVATPPICSALQKIQTGDSTMMEDRVKGYGRHPGEGDDPECKSDEFDASAFHKRLQFVARLRRSLEARRVEQGAERKAQFTDDYEDDMLIGCNTQAFDEDDDDAPVVRPRSSGIRPPLRK
jgi:hypothetical protein